MAITLAESAKLATTDLQRGVIETFVLESTVLDRIPLLDIAGNAYAYNEEATLPGVEFRAVNGTYSESTGTVNQRSEILYILGGEADVDTFVQQTRGKLNDQRAVQTDMKVKALAYKYQDQFINGDSAVDVNSFDGLKKRLVGNQVISAGTNGIPVLGTTDVERNAFWDKMDEAMASVVGRVDAIYANKQVLAKMRSNARRLLAYDQTTDAFGKTIQTYNGIPLLDIGTKPDGTTPIIPQTETQGSSNVASSIYFVHFGQGEADRGVTGLTNGGVMVEDLGKLQSRPAWRTRIEFFCGLAVFGGRAAARLTGVLAS